MASAFMIIDISDSNIAYADQINSVGSNLTNSELDNNSDAFGNQSEAHKKEEEKVKGQDGKEDVEAGQWLQSHEKWVQFGTLMTWIGHQMGWFAIKGTYFISSYVEEAVTQIMSFISGLFGGNLINQIFGSSANSLFNGATAVAWTVLGVAITYWGLRYVWYGDKRLEIHSMLLNVVLVALFLVASSTIISKTMEVGIGTYNAVREETSGKLKGGFSLQIIKNNVVDLQKVIENNNTKAVADSNTQGYNNLTDSFVKTADMAEILDTENMKKDSKIKNYLQYQISDVDDKGNITAEKIDNGWFSIFKAGYFRFGTRFFNIISELLIMAVTIALYGYLILRNAIDLLFTKIIGGIASAKDIDRGEALRMVISDIGRSALGIACTGISLCVFIHLFNGINNQNWNPVAHTIALLACAVACLDGASVFDRYFGIDIGLRSGWQATVGAFAGAKTASTVATGAMKTAGAVAGGAIKGGTAIKNGVMDAIGSVSGNNTNTMSQDNESSESKDSSVINGLNTINDNDNQANTEGSQTLNEDKNNQNESTNNSQVNGDSDSVNGTMAQTDADGAVVANMSQGSDDDLVNAEGDVVDSTSNVDDMDHIDADNQNLTNQEDDDINSLNQTDLDDNQMDTNNTALENDQISQNIENDVNNQESDVINGVDIADSEAIQGQIQEVENGISANEANDVDAGMINRLEAEQMDAMNQAMNTEEGVSNESPIEHNETTSSMDVSSSMTDSSQTSLNNNMNSTQMYDNSNAMMSQLSQQSQTLNQNVELCSMSTKSGTTFDPTRRVTHSSHIKMPEFSSSDMTDLTSHESNGGAESFDHTK